MARATFKELIENSNLRDFPPGTKGYDDPDAPTWLYMTKTPEGIPNRASGQFFTFEPILMLDDHIIVKAYGYECSEFEELEKITNFDADGNFLARINMKDDSPFITSDEAAQIEECIAIDQAMLANAR